VSVQIGVSPIAWVNDDMPELGGGTRLETILRDADEIGFTGIELGGIFPRDAATLRPLLGAHHLELAGGWFGGRLLSHGVEAEIARARDHLALLAAMGCTVFIYAEVSNAIHGARDMARSARPRLSNEIWKVFGERLTEFAETIAAEGFRLAYHPHLGTVVEGPEDLAAFIAHTGEAAGLTLDTGHATLAGIDPIAVIGAHPGRIAHVHCKDVRGAVFEAVRVREMSFLGGVLAGMFTAPGDGDLDWPAVMGALAAIGYSGWMVVEAEQDPAMADPKTFSAMGLATLRSAARAAGLAVATGTGR